MVVNKVRKRYVLQGKQNNTCFNVKNYKSRNSTKYFSKTVINTLNRENSAVKNVELKYQKNKHSRNQYLATAVITDLFFLVIFFKACQ